MKKILAFALILALALTLMTACDLGDILGGGDNDDGGGSNSSKDKGSDEKFGYGTDFINNNLKGNYWVVYNISTHSNGDTDSAVMEQRRTSEGYYYATDGGEEGMMFIANGDDYDLYMPNGDGLYTKSGITYPKDTAESMMYGISMYMSSYAGFGSELVKSGSATIAGRDCEKYTFDYTYPVYGYKYKYTYFIDKATGVCLKFDMELNGAGQKIGYEFECSKFETSNVKLPDYEK